MSPRLPQASGRELLRMLERMGYRRLRQRGSHVRLEKKMPGGTHLLTIPMHPALAKGTLHDILSAVALRHNLPLQELADKL